MEVDGTTEAPDGNMCVYFIQVYCGLLFTVVSTLNVEWEVPEMCDLSY